MRFLITGNCGFIGQNFVRLYGGQHEIWGIDKMGYASDTRALELCETIKGDIRNVENFDLPQFDGIINFAADSHVDNSIAAPEPFIYSNISITPDRLDGLF